MSPALPIAFLVLSLCGLSVAAPADRCPFRACECVHSWSDPSNVYTHVSCTVDQSSDLTTLFAAGERQYRVTGELTITGRVQKIPANVFKALSSIARLKLVYNDHESTTTAATNQTTPIELDPAAFEGVTIRQLTLVNLAGIVPIPEAIKGLGRRGLHALTIANADQSGLSLDAFFLDRFDTLNSLTIQDTPITKIHDNAFANLPLTLNSLALRSASLAKFPRNAINMLTHLVALDLSNNQIGDIEEGDFKPYGQLIRLTLSGNNLAPVLQSGGLNKLPATLTDLTVDNCGLTSIPASVMAGNPNLVALSAVGNNIKLIEAGDFPEVNKLQRLYLNRNPIVSIENGSLNVLKSLEILELKETAVTMFDLSVCNDMNRVILDLSDNPELKSVDASSVDVPDYHHGLSELFISNTAIERLDAQLRHVINSHYFDRIIFTNNRHFICDEFSYWMAEYAICSNPHLDIDDTTCANGDRKSLREYLQGHVTNPCKGEVNSKGKQ